MEQLLWLIGGALLGIAATVVFQMKYQRQPKDSGKAVASENNFADNNLTEKKDKFLQLRPFDTAKNFAKSGFLSSDEEAKGSILIPVQGLHCPKQALHLAIKMALLMNQSLHLLILVEVPQFLSLENSLDEEMEKALEIAERVELKAKLAKIAIETSIVKVRNNTMGIVEAANATNAKLVILEQVGERTALQTPSLAQQAEVIGRKTSSNVLVLNPNQNSISLDLARQTVYSSK